MLIEAQDFVLEDELRMLALQGDWGVRNEVGPQGGRFVVDDRPRARKACNDFLARVRASDAQVALIPELAIPRDAVADIVATISNFPRQILFVGGIEGLTRQEYLTVLNDLGESQAVVQGAAEGYVNSLLVIVKTATQFTAHVRAKRVPSRAENQHGPPMAPGQGPFTVIRLGPNPLTIVPLICAEFVWAEELWTRLDQEVQWNIDVVPVLQRNDDLQARHIGPQLHRAYTRGARSDSARFILTNQAIGAGCDGTSYVVVPPTAPADPAFDHSLNELWHLPGTRTYKGFRIPDRTGCIWSARIVNPRSPTNALGNRLCSGFVSAVLVPADAELRGLSVGLMRSVAAVYRHGLLPHAGTGAYDAAVEALDHNAVRYILSSISTAAANDVVHRMHCAERPLWGTVESIISELVEAAALLASGGDRVELIPCDGGNCSFNQKPIAVLYAPTVDVALVHRR